MKYGETIRATQENGTRRRNLKESIDVPWSCVRRLKGQRGETSDHRAAELSSKVLAEIRGHSWVNICDSNPVKNMCGRYITLRVQERFCSPKLGNGASGNTSALREERCEEGKR